jgi:hypothetical protein
MPTERMEIISLVENRTSKAASRATTKSMAFKLSHSGVFSGEDWSLMLSKGIDKVSENTEYALGEEDIGGTLK